MHYGDALTPQNIPLGHFFSPRVKRFGCRNFHLAGASGLPRSTERIRGSGVSCCAVKYARAAGWIEICDIRLAPYLSYSPLFNLSSSLLFITKHTKGQNKSRLRTVFTYEVHC